ncbi:MAG: dephospho-CoA kinase [Bacillota bacterium]
MIIGLTGNIGSGKSSVAAYLSELGAKVVDTDQVARQIVAPGSPALAELIAAFGPGILNPDGTLNRAKMASIVFNSPGARQTLNKITHPRIRAEVNRHIDDHRRQSGAPALVIEAPLLIEAGFHHLVDEIWLVAADEETMLRRVARRDNTNLEQAAGRLASQMPQSEKIPLAHRVIDNNGAPEDFKRQVDRLWYTVVVQSK